jgi:hypothetical protein
MGVKNEAVTVEKLVALQRINHNITIHPEILLLE